MARKFLTPIDLNKLELQNAAFQNLGVAPGSPSIGQFYYDTSTTPKQLKVWDGTAWVSVGSSEEEIEDIVNGLVVAGTGISKNYDDEAGTLTIGNTGVTAITGTASEVNVSASVGSVTISLPDTINADTSGNAATATALQNARSISLSGGASGSASFNGTSDITIPVTIDSNSTVTSITGTTNEVDVSASVGAVTISLPATINADLNGNAASATYAVNSGSASYATTAGTANAVAANSVALGTDTTGNYVATVTGTTNEIEVSGSGSENAAITIGLPETVTLGNLNVTGALTVSGSATYVNTEIVTIDDNIVLLNSNATTASQNAGIEVERGTVESNVSILWNETSDTWTLTNDGTNYHNITRKFSYDVGDTSNTNFSITHSLGTRDVVVNVYDNATYDTVEADIVRTSTSVVTVSFATAPGNNAYRVVIVG